jgi:hypothetical protein
MSPQPSRSDVPVRLQGKWERGAISTALALKELRDLIFRIVAENRTNGAPRIHCRAADARWRYRGARDFRFVSIVSVENILLDDVLHGDAGRSRIAISTVLTGGANLLLRSNPASPIRSRQREYRWQTRSTSRSCSTISRRNFLAATTRRMNAQPLSQDTSIFCK